MEQPHKTNSPADLIPKTFTFPMKFSFNSLLMVRYNHGRVCEHHSLQQHRKSLAAEVPFSNLKVYVSRPES
jgi:hypothetical protein